MIEESGTAGSPSSIRARLPPSPLRIGGGPLSVFRTTLLPLTATGIRIAFAFAFVLAAGDYVTPELVGGTNGIMIGNIVADHDSVVTTRRLLRSRHSRLPGRTMLHIPHGTCRKPRNGRGCQAVEA